MASSIQQIPWWRNTSSFINSSEHRKYVHEVLKEELGPMYVEPLSLVSAFSLYTAAAGAF